MLRKKFQRPGTVLRGDHLVENDITLLLLTLLMITYITAYQQEERQGHKQRSYRHTSDGHGHGDDKAEHESRSRRHEPTADDRNHTSDAEYRALPAPRLVGQ